MCTEADLVSGSRWAQYNMFIAQSVFFLSCPLPMAFIPFDLGIYLPPFWFFHSFPSDLFPSCALSSSLASSLVPSILISLFFHLYKFVCHIITMFWLPLIFHVTLISDPFIFCHLCFVSQNRCYLFYGGFQHIWDKKKNTTWSSSSDFHSFSQIIPSSHTKFLSCSSHINIATGIIFHAMSLLVFFLCVCLCVCVLLFSPLYFHFPTVYSPLNALFIVFLVLKAFSTSPCSCNDACIFFPLASPSVQRIISGHAFQFHSIEAGIHLQTHLTMSSNSKFWEF